MIEDRSPGTFLGDCGLTYHTVEDDQLLELGSDLQIEHRGKGYALERARCCAVVALRVLDAPAVCSIVDPRNESSIRVASTIHDSMRTYINAARSESNLYWTDNRSHRRGVDHP